MIIYSTEDGVEVINKNLLVVSDGKIVLRKVEDINRIEMYLNNSFLLDGNYCYLKDVGKYYFINVISVLGSVSKVSLVCDFLESFKSEILLTDFKYFGGKTQNNYLDYNGVESLKKDRTFLYSDNSLEVEETMILSTVGL